MISRYIMLLMMPVLVTSGQLLLKSSTGEVITGKGFIAFAKSIIFHPRIILAIILVAGAPLLYIIALDSVPLSEAFAFNSLNYVLVFFTARIILKEKVNAFQVAGVILIAAGFLFPLIAEAAGA